MKHILVTGGAGFIGSYLVERLQQLGHLTFIVDNLSSNVVDPQSLGGTWVIDSVQDFCSWRTSYQGYFDEIYHLASPVGAAGVLSHAGNMVREIVDDTYAIMELAQKCGAKLVNVSTSEVYGGGINGQCAEDTPRIISPDTTVRLEYAVAKLAAETAILNTCKVSDLHATIVRPFNVAGARQSPKNGFVLPRFLQQALSGQSLTVFGDGSQVRAFTNVRDIVDGLIRVMERGVSGEAYNLGNPANKTTILDLANRVIDRVGQGSITFTDGKAVFGELFAEAADKYPDATKAMRELGWTPTRTIDDTITDAYEYARSQRELSR